MKAALIAIALGMASMANATPLPSKVSTGLNRFSTSTIPSFEAANRKGIKRVGGYGKSGKGSRYVGGRSK